MIYVNFEIFKLDRCTILKMDYTLQKRIKVIETYENKETVKFLIYFSMNIRPKWVNNANVREKNWFYRDSCKPRSEFCTEKIASVVKRQWKIFNIGPRRFQALSMDCSAYFKSDLRLHVYNRS